MIKERIKTHVGLVKKMRAVRDKIGTEIQGMTLEEEKEYLDRLCSGSKSSPHQIAE